MEITFTVGPDSGWTLDGKESRRKILAVVVRIYLARVRSVVMRGVFRVRGACGQRRIADAALHPALRPWSVSVDGEPISRPALVTYADERSGVVRYVDTSRPTVIADGEWILDERRGAVLITLDPLRPLGIRRLWHRHRHCA